MADEKNKSLEETLKAAAEAKRRSEALRSQSENTAGAKIKNGALDDAAAKAAARHGYKKIKYGVIDFCKKVAEWAVGTKVWKGVETVGKYTGWTKLWKATKPSKWSWKAEDPNQTSWQTFKNRCKKVMGITTHAWLLAWPLAPILALVPGVKSLPGAEGAAEIGNYWTWEPTIDLIRMGVNGGINKDIIYLNNKTQDQSDISADKWIAQGVRELGSTDTKDAISFRAENRLSLQIYNLFKHGKLYVARDKVTPIEVGGKTPYEVINFGGDYRFTSTLQAMPYFLEMRPVEMRPVSGEFNTEAGTNLGTTITPTQQATPVAPQPATP